MLLLFGRRRVPARWLFRLPIGYRNRQIKGDADGERERHDPRKPFKELQSHAKE